MSKGKENFKEDEMSKTTTPERKNGGRRSGRRNSGKKGNSGSENKKRGDINDASIYYTDPNILAQVTNFSFNEFLGVPSEFGRYMVNSTDTGWKIAQEKVTNVVRFKLNPSIQPTGPESGVKYSAINVTGLKNFTLLSANNAKTTSYAPQDVTMLMLAIQEIIKMYEFCKRPFNSYLLINQRNRSYPEILFKAMGINYTDFKSHIADYREQFNTIVALFDKIPFFTEVSAFSKASEVYKWIYIDEDTPLAQTYLFVPNSTWILDEAYDPNGSGLVTTPVVETSPKNFQDYLDIFNEQVTALSSSSTFNAIFSDILRLVQNGKGTTLMLKTIGMGPDPDYRPVINDEIRHWINNAVLMSMPRDKDALPGAISVGTTNSNDVVSVASENGIMYNPTWVAMVYETPNLTDAYKEYVLASNTMYKNRLVNFDSMTPSVEDKVAATRLALRAEFTLWKDPATNNWYNYSHNCVVGDTYCSEMDIYTDVNADPIVIGAGGYASTNPSLTIFKWVDKLTKLKYAPRIPLYLGESYNPAEEDQVLVGVLGDLTYYTALDHKFMKALRDAEMLSEYMVRI